MKMFSLIAKSVSQDTKLTFKLLIWVHQFVYSNDLVTQHSLISIVPTNGSFSSFSNFSYSFFSVSYFSKHSSSANGSSGQASKSPSSSPKFCALLLEHSFFISLSRNPEHNLIRSLQNRYKFHKYHYWRPFVPLYNFCTMLRSENVFFNK